MPFQTTIPLRWNTRKDDEFSIHRQDTDTPQDSVFEDHWHDCFEILYILDGNREFTVENVSYQLKTGDVLVIPPHLSHSSAGGLCSVIVFGYAESVIYTPDNSFTGLQYVMLFRHASARLLQGDSENLCRLRSLLLQGYELYKGTSPVRRLEMHACILQVHGIIWQMYLDNGSNPDVQSRYLIEAQEYIEAHLQEDISPYEIAAALHISHSHFCRILRASLNTTPAALINRYRLCLAEKLLTGHPELRITDIAFQCGFHDISYFIRYFRKENGITPMQFRQSFVPQNKQTVPKNMMENETIN
ncbi:MAG: helix-turn-helix transcriptional regulator [Clostridia bacterium]|nr:helix-turn-helix transcriptional regulator [Clostridia bacterium]